MKLLVVFLVFLLDVNALGRPKIARAIQPVVNEISLKLLPPHENHRKHHNHEYSAPMTTKASPSQYTTRAPSPQYSTEASTTTKKPVTSESNSVETLHYEFVNLPNGYRFSYDLSDGTSRYESMEIKNLPDGTQINVVTGSYSYIDTNNELYRVDYSADENGYVVQKPQQITAPSRIY